MLGSDKKQNKQTKQNKTKPISVKTIFKLRFKLGSSLQAKAFVYFFIFYFFYFFLSFFFWAVTTTNIEHGILILFLTLEWWLMTDPHPCWTNDALALINAKKVIAWPEEILKL